MKSSYSQSHFSFDEKNHSTKGKKTNNCLYTLLIKRINILNNVYYSQFTRQQYNIDINPDFDLLDIPFENFDENQIEAYDFCYNKIINTPSTTLHYSYLNLPKQYQTSSLVLNKIKYLREALADGDSYYRCFIYKYIQQIIAFNTTFLLKLHIQSIINLLNNNNHTNAFKARDVKVNLNDILSIFRVLLSNMITIGELKDKAKADEMTLKTLHFFEKAFNNNHDCQFGLVKYVKLVISNYIRKVTFFDLNKNCNSHLINAKYVIDKDKLDQEGYINDNIEQMQICPSLLIVHFSAMAFYCSISLFVEEKSCIMKRQFNLNKKNNRPDLINISILYSRHKYDLAYTDSDDIILLNFNKLLLKNDKSKTNNSLGIINLLKSNIKRSSSSSTHSNFLSSNDNNNANIEFEDLVRTINKVLNQRIAFFYSDFNCNFEYYCSPIVLKYNNGNSLTVYDKDIFDLKQKGYFTTESIREQLLFLMNKKCLICTSKSGDNQFPSEYNMSICKNCFELAKSFFNHS